jgi:hypothetical protein
LGEHGGEDAATRADFKHGALGDVTQGLNDAAGVFLAVEEVLAQFGL